MSNTLPSLKSRLSKALKKNSDDFQRQALLKAENKKLTRNLVENQKSFRDQRAYIDKYSRESDKEFEILENHNTNLVDIIQNMLKTLYAGAEYKKYTKSLDSIISRYRKQLQSQRNNIANL
jgi:hypothetical protein